MMQQAPLEIKEEQSPIIIIPQRSEIIARQKIKNNNRKKALILDSGTLINLSMNGLLYIFEELKKVSDAEFVITKEVKYEVVDRPIEVPRFELEALRVQSLIDNKIISLPKEFGISEEEIKIKTRELKEVANHSISSGGKWISIVSDAEMSCLALSLILEKKGIENMIAVDERTTRILAEKPENLEEIMSKKLHNRVELNKNKLAVFSKFKFIRSTELAYVAFKKNLLKVKGPKVLEAVLLATKYKGSSVSFEEIKELKGL